MSYCECVGIYRRLADMPDNLDMMVREKEQSIDEQWTGEYAPANVAFIVVCVG